MTLVDSQQIDCIVREDCGEEEPRYYDVQIKARSSEAQRVSWARWPNVKILKPRQGLYFVFYSDRSHDYWVIPSRYLVEHSLEAKKGHGTVTLAKWSSDDGPPEYVEASEQYLGAFDQLGGSREL
jgi:hypothetical protein